MQDREWPLLLWTRVFTFLEETTWSRQKPWEKLFSCFFLWIGLFKTAVQSPRSKMRLQFARSLFVLGHRFPVYVPTVDQLEARWPPWLPTVLAMGYRSPVLRALPRPKKEIFHSSILPRVTIRRRTWHMAGQFFLSKWWACTKDCHFVGHLWFVMQCL